LQTVARVSRLLLVDDHTLVREGMAAALRGLGPDAEVLQARDAESAMRLLERDSGLDLVLLDLMLPGIDGFALLGVLRQRFPELPVLVVSALGDADTIDRVARGGASGFVHKSNSGLDLLGAVRAVLDGNSYFAEPDPGLCEAGQAVRKRDLARRFCLSVAQSRVLELLSQGKTNREIGELLGLAEGTVKSHLNAVYRALSVTSRAQALVMMRRWR
jgi:DNA-binding NarL/FixJ family response regulator